MARPTRLAGEVPVGFARRLHDVGLSRRRLDERGSDLASGAKSGPCRLAMLAAVGVTLGRRERELIELVVDGIDDDLVEFLAIHDVGSAQCACVLLEVGESFLQALERVPHSAFDGVLGRSRDLGDLLKSKVSHVAEQEHLTLLVGKRFDRSHDLDLDLVRNCAPLGRRPRVQVGDLLTERRPLARLASAPLLIERGMTPVRCLAQVIDAEVTRDGVRPRRELGLVFEGTCTLDDPQKNLLGQILRGGGRLGWRSTKLKSGVLCRSTSTANAPRSPRW
jgi:hypothetical protein